MKNSLTSECSNGCESGWTMYLDESSTSLNLCNNIDHDYQFNEEFCKQKVPPIEEQEEEEDSSMVSDASSGPSHLHEHYYTETEYSPSITKPMKKNSKKQKIQKHQEHYSSLLDDTASSTVFSFTKNNFTLTNKQEDSMDNLLNFSQGYSDNQVKERSTLIKKGFGKEISAKPVICRKESGDD